jgi:molybdopterin adenylyltransferase
MSTNITNSKNKNRQHPDEVWIGLISISDRASSGVYQDEGIPALENWFSKTLLSPWHM